MAARVYTVSMSNLTVIANATLLFINPGTTNSLRVKRIGVSQQGTSTAQQLGILIQSQVTAFPTVVSATPARTMPTDAISTITGATTGAAGTCGVNASANGAGTKTVIVADAFNNLNGYLWVATPDEEIWLSAGSASGLAVTLVGTPTTLTGWNAYLFFEEV